MLRLDVIPSRDVRVRQWAQSAPPSSPWPAGAHDALEIAWTDQGCTSYRVGSSHFVVPASAACLVPRGVEHQTSFAAPMTASSVWLSPTLVDGIADAMGGRARMEAGLLPQPEPVIQLGRMLVRAARATDRGRDLAAGSLAQALVIEVLRQRGLDDRFARATDPRVRAAIDLIESAYDQPLSIDTVARQVGLSRYQLSRLFKAATGTSPYQYLLEARIRRASELLRSGRCNVTEAAFEVGFSDSSRFARAFRRHTGRTPSEVVPLRRTNRP